MRKRIQVLTLCILIGLSSVAAQQKGYRVELKPVLEMQYLLYLPDGYESDSKAEFPLLLFLHGGGSSGDDIEMLKRNGLAGKIEEGRSFPFMLLAQKREE